MGPQGYALALAVPSSLRCGSTSGEVGQESWGGCATPAAELRGFRVRTSTIDPCGSGFGLPLKTMMTRSSFDWFFIYPQVENMK